MPAAEPAGAGERKPWDDDEDKDLPVNLRPSIDDQFARGDEDGAESDERLPQTPLEAKLVSLIGQQGQAKYLGPTVSKARAIRKQLNSLNHKGKFKEVPRDHPSAEDEWKRDPAGFSAYVETCAALIRNESKKNDSDDSSRQHGRSCLSRQELRPVQDRLAVLSRSPQTLQEGEPPGH